MPTGSSVKGKADVRMATPDRPVMPPLLDVVLAPKGGSVLDRAKEGAAAGVFEAGTLVYRCDDRLAFALVLEPEVGPDRAAAMHLLAQLAFAEAIMSIAPPETTVDLVWTGAIHLNGARVGQVEGAMGEPDETGVPGWLAIATTAVVESFKDGGRTPDRTSLTDELGPDLDPLDLIEAAARQWTLWLYRWDREGLAPLARQWTTHARTGTVITSRSESGEPVEGAFLGLDESGNALIENDGATHVLSLLALWSDGRAR